MLPPTDENVLNFILFFLEILAKLYVGAHLPPPKSWHFLLWGIVDLLLPVQ